MNIPSADVGTDVAGPLVVIAVDPARGLRLIGEATIHSVSRLVLQMQALELDPASNIALDLSELTLLDSAGAQALIAFRRSYPALTVHSCPPNVRHFIERAGLTCILTN